MRSGTIHQNEPVENTQHARRSDQQEPVVVTDGIHAASGNREPSSPTPLLSTDSEYFDLNVLKGAVSFNTKPFKHRALVWIGLWKVLLFPFCYKWWLPRIGRWRFLGGCTLYILHNVCAWLYVRRFLEAYESPAGSTGRAGAATGTVTPTEILLPYIIGGLFAVGYGSVVSAGGWEALRVPVRTTMGVEKEGGSGCSVNGNGGNGSTGDNGSTDGTGGGARRGDIPFAAQVCARDTHEEEAGGMAMVEDDLESSASSSETEETEEEHEQEEAAGGSRVRGGVGTCGDAPANPPASSSGANRGRDEGAWVGGNGTGSEGSARRVDDKSSAQHESAAAAGKGDRIALLQQFSSCDLSMSEVDEEEDEDDEGCGWGPVVVKPVKVAQWDRISKQWGKASLSLPELRRLILERAESTPQNVTYSRAARVGILVTTSLPMVFGVCLMLAAAWADSSELGCGGGACREEQPWFAGLLCHTRNGTTGAVERKACVFLALARALRAGGAVILRALWPAEVDGLAVATALVSMSSVAFVAWPTYFALAEAERTYQRRYMYSKFFCALTSSQRARKHRLPHFSLKNVANIRVWLALRAGKTWLRRHRQERSADAIASMAFFLSIALITAIITEVVSREARFLSTLLHWELLVWCCFVSFFLLRYLTLGSHTNNRYRDTSVLLTEQINVQLRILQNSTRSGESKASKRERLVVSSNVLKLATKLLKELDGPNKLSGLSMNPVLYNITRVVLVSALSGVMSDTLGFNIKLWKILSFK